MTAICKTIAIHGSNLSHLLDYGANQEKTSVSMNGLSNVLEYAANPLKTIANLEDGDKELLVSGVLCQPETSLVVLLPTVRFAVFLFSVLLQCLLWS